jgi:hypothetical protein
MVEVVLTPEQMASMKPGEGVFLRSPAGELVGRVDDSITEEELAHIQKILARRGQPQTARTLTTAEVMDELRKRGLI